LPFAAIWFNSTAKSISGNGFFWKASFEISFLMLASIKFWISGFRMSEIKCFGLKFLR